MFEGPHVKHCCASTWLGFLATGVPNRHPVAVAAIIIVIGTWWPNGRVADTVSALPCP